jgi:hypothetical protein
MFAPQHEPLWPAPDTTHHQAQCGAVLSYVFFVFYYLLFDLFDNQLGRKFKRDA